MTSLEYEAWLAKRGMPDQRNRSNSGTTAPESDLHDYIIKRCRELGWPYGHGSMAHRTRYVEGFPDFVIFASRSPSFCIGCNEWRDIPRTLLIEVKTKTGKLSPAQQAFAAACAKVGHRVWVVRSEQEFEELIK